METPTVCVYVSPRPTQIECWLVSTLQAYRPYVDANGRPQYATPDLNGVGILHVGDRFTAHPMYGLPDGHLAALFVWTQKKSHDELDVLADWVQRIVECREFSANQDYEYLLPAMAVSEAVRSVGGSPAVPNHVTISDSDPDAYWRALDSLNSSMQE